MDESKLHFAGGKGSYFLANKNQIRKDEYRKRAVKTIKRYRFPYTILELSFIMVKSVYLFIFRCC